jgi:hypothetical protein
MKAVSLRSMIFVTLLFLVVAVGTASAQMPGAIFTTDSGCTGTDLNLYQDKDAVYINGGPAHPGAAGLPDGDYYVQVTEPNGTLLGSSLAEKPVHVLDGAFVQCYQLSSIVKKASAPATFGFDTTSNSGGEYKVWVSQVGGFDANMTKTDNFKVQAETSVSPGLLTVIKFYDANADGQFDSGEQEISDWPILIVDDLSLYRTTPVSVYVAPDLYTVTECYPEEQNWMHTTDNPVYAEVMEAEQTNVEFGNLCLGGGGGLTLGYWSNKNGKALFGADDLALMVSLHLRDGGGSDFDPADYDAFRTWLLGAKATNMAYMLSVQLAAMELNVLNGKVNGDALIYAPGATSANSLGFASVNAVMAEADAELALHGLTLAHSPDREYQEALKDALDKANNNFNFVQASPCQRTFACSLPD